MSTKVKNDARLSVRLPADLKEIIETAASHQGQSVSDFAVSTLVENARNILQQHSVTVLSKRDWDLFMALLDDKDARPNKVLKDAARRYKKHFG